MSWTRIPGTRQDHTGRIYEYWRNSRGQTDVRYIDEAKQKPIRVVLSHTWTIGPDVNEVDVCHKTNCKVCGTSVRPTLYSINRGAQS